MKPIRRMTLRLPVFLCLAVSASAAGLPFDIAGLSNGLCVVLEDARCRKALELARQPGLMIYMQAPDDASLAAARRSVLEAPQPGLLNRRIWIGKGPATRLHLAGNLADAVWTDSGTALPEAEALRVLRPLGQARLGTRDLVKPAPPGVDEWSHPYHSPDNNPASRDQAARAPYLTQFLADPRYAPLPQVAVASGGRVFKAFGHIAFKEREEGWLNTLAAFNGYNGALLWRRETAAALMVHRSTLIATPDKVYFGDDLKCSVLDAATGRLLDEIAPAADTAGGTFWKWMALEDGVLYALIGEPEKRDPVIKARMSGHGWPWDPLSPGFNSRDHTWGYGQTILAIDPATHKILWRHQEEHPIDSRAVCLKDGRLFALSFGRALACLDTRTGSVLWRHTPESAPALFEAVGPYSKRQDWRTNWRTTAYLKCGPKALYFSGPTVEKLLAVSVEDGRVLWQHPYNNYQTVLQDGVLYGVSGQIDSEPSRAFDPLTGRVLAEIATGRRACTRPTAAADALFFRAGEGSTRLDLARRQPQLISPMRPNCQDGVTIANGLLYWWPSVCDCNLTLYGITCLGPADDFNFDQPATDAGRFEPGPAASAPAGPAPDPADWPVFRANNHGTAVSQAVIPLAPGALLTVEPAFAPETNPAIEAPFRTAPTVAAGRLYFSGSDGVVVSLPLAAAAGPAWRAALGGAVRYPPTLWNGRAYAGCDDGWVYCLDAATGALMWRFRAAPEERQIPVYGRLSSTWPAASGVLIQNGLACVAAGIVSMDGTHVYALDALTGRLRWQNNASGLLDPETGAGVSVQGHMLAAGGRLYLAGGNAVSPACYDLASGRCYNDPAPLRKTDNNHVPGAFAPRGCELYEAGGAVRVSGKPLYAHPQWPVYDGQVTTKTLVSPAGSRDVFWVNNARVVCCPRVEERRDERLRSAWGKPALNDLKPAWSAAVPESLAIAVCRNAVVVAMPRQLVAYGIEDGRELWRQPLPAAPVPWGLAVGREGQLAIALADGRVLSLPGNTGSAR